MSEREICAGGWGFGEEKNPLNIEVPEDGVAGVLLIQLETESILWFVSLFCCLLVVCSIPETPKGTGAEEPVNQEDIPPPTPFARGLSETFTTPSRSPVKVGMNSSSNPFCEISFIGLRLRLGLRWFEEKVGRSSVRDR